MGWGGLFTSLVLAVAMIGGAAIGGVMAQPSQAKEYDQQFLLQGLWFHGVHGLAFNKDDQLFAGSVIGQTIYRVQIDSGEVDRFIGGPVGMADYTHSPGGGTM